MKRTEMRNEMSDRCARAGITITARGVRHSGVLEECRLTYITGHCTDPDTDGMKREMHHAFMRHYMDLFNLYVVSSVMPGQHFSNTPHLTIKSGRFTITQYHGMDI